MMQLAVPKQNGCQKCVVQLDTKANEKVPLPNFFAHTQSNSCDEFLEPGAKPLTTESVLGEVVSGAKLGRFAR
jgi:hypothetical protein